MYAAARAALFACAALLAPPVLAQGLVEVQVPTTTEQSQQRDVLLREALKAAIVQEFGLPAEQVPPSVLDGAGRMAQRFGVERDRADTSQLVFRAAFERDAIADLLRNAGLVQPQQLTDADLVITGIDGVRDYGWMLSSLQGKRGLEKVTVMAVAGDRVEVRLRYDAAVTTPEQLLAESGLDAIMAAPAPQNLGY